MGEKTSFTLKILAASLFVMLLTVFLMTDNFSLSSSADSEGQDVAVGDVEDGTYTGTGEGFNGPIEVEVTVAGGEIEEVVVLDHNESEGISDPAIENIPTAIVDNGSTDVDVASGATFSSEGIMAAVNDALSDSDVADDEAATSYEDGTHLGAAEGHNGPIEVEVTVENSEITGVTILEHSESEDISDPAIEETPAAIVENNSTDVDVASGATVSSEAIMAAVEDALTASEIDETPDSYADGTHLGAAEGLNGPIELEVTVENGEILDITVLEHSETEDLSDPAFDQVPAAIIENNSTDVDVASGATVSSDAIMAAVEDALAGDSSEETATYTDGTYQGSAEGAHGLITLEVTVENGEIAGVTIHGHNETEDLTDEAFEQIPAAIVESNSTDVDVASGATVTSDAIMEAIENALAQAN